jgi:hypothetical protein
MKVIVQQVDGVASDIRLVWRLSWNSICRGVCARALALVSALVRGMCAMCVSLCVCSGEELAGVKEDDEGEVETGQAMIERVLTTISTTISQ